MSSNPQRKSTSKSPSILPAEFLTPAPPLPSPGNRAQTHGSSSDIGVIKLSGQVSQNDERLPKPAVTSQQPSGSESGSGPSEVIMPELPLLDVSPADYSLGHHHRYTPNSSQGTTSQSQSQTRYTRYSHYHHEAESQSVDVLSFQDIGPSMVDHGPDVGDSSYSHHSENSTFSIHNSSGESSSNRTNSSFLTNTSGSLNSRSSESQADSITSQISFTNVETSTPQQTPTPIRSLTSQKSTPSDSDVNSSSSQMSPVARHASQLQRRRRESQENGTTLSLEVVLTQAGSSSGRRPILSIPENEPITIHDDYTQSVDPFGTDPSHEEIEAAFEQTENLVHDGEQTQTIDIFESVPQLDEDIHNDEDLSQHGEDESDIRPGTNEDGKEVADELISSIGMTPPAWKSLRRVGKVSKETLRGNGVDAEYLSSDDDEETSRSITGAKIDLHISQSQIELRKARADEAASSGPALSVEQKEDDVATLTLERTTSTTISSKTFVTTSSTAPVTVSTRSAIEPPMGGTDPTSTPANETSEPDVELCDIPSTPPRIERSNSRSRATRREPVSRMNRPVRLNRSPSSLAGLELPSSQKSSSHPSADSFLQRLRSSAERDRSVEPQFSAVPKRQRLREPTGSLAAEAKAQEAHVLSSIGDEEFWEGSEKSPAPADSSQHVRSRSGSQDISSFPDDLPSELEIEEPSEPSEPSTQGPAAGHEEVTATGPSSPPRTPTRASSRTKTSQARELRRKGSSASQASQLSQPSQPSQSTTPTRRTLRRIHSVADGLRVYKTQDPVWAKWRKDYYAGVVLRRHMDRYDIHFLDNDISTCDGSQMRPLKLKLGAEVMAKKSETMDHSAIVEGIRMAAELDQSRVDVRFSDNGEANLPLNFISLTTDMMDKLDAEMDWDQDETRSGDASRPMARQTSFSFPSLLMTPTKGKRRTSLSQRSLSGSLTPSRHGKGATSGSVPATPSRRGKDLFKDMRFVLSLTGPGGSKELERDTSAKIRAGGGQVLDDFSSVLDAQYVVQPNVLLISFTTLRTAKYIEALALNIPRLSYRWIDSCNEARQLLPYQSYLLPTGFSKELGTIVSSSPHNDQGIFAGLQIGLCGSSSFRSTWERPLNAAGATVVNVNSRSGAMNCNYIVFYSAKSHRQYCQDNTAVPSLSDEWLIQCLINQRVMLINSHPSYTDLDSKKIPPV